MTLQARAGRTLQDSVFAQRLLGGYCQKTSQTSRMTDHVDVGWAAHVHPTLGVQIFSELKGSREFPSETATHLELSGHYARMGVCEELRKRLETEEGGKKKIQV